MSLQNTQPSTTGWTSTTGVSWTHNTNYTQGGVSFGLEAWFYEENSISWQQPIPFGITSLTITGGTIKVWGETSARVEGLIRIGIIGDPSLGDGGCGPGSFLIINHDLPATNGVPNSMVIPPFYVPCGNGAIQVPLDGTGYQLKAQIWLAGGGFPVDVEFEACGRWSTLPL